MKRLLQQLTGIYSTSGNEGEIRTAILKEVRAAADECRVDALGNLIVRKGKLGKDAGRAGGKRIMIAAHMDEIGLIVTHVDDNGFVRFTSVGYLFTRNLPGGRVRFANGVPGMIGVEPTEREAEVPSVDKMFIDVGSSSRKDCPVRVGDVAAFERPFLDLGERVVAKSLDNRASCVVAIEALKQLKSTPHEVYFVFTTQEEVGSHGAETSAYGVDPDLGFSLDVTPSGDTPGIKHVDIALGSGPAIKIRDSGMLSDPRIVEWMTRAAERGHIPYQREVLVRGSTDAMAMQLVRAGIPVGCISIPCRYVHSPSEMVDMHDMQNAVNLTVATLRSPIHW